MTEPAARLRDVGLRYGRTAALDGVTLEIPGGIMAGLIGPDGVGKSSLLSLIAGARAIQAGRVEVFGGEMADARHRAAVGPRIAYMPQGLGKNLYPTLSVAENIDFFGRLFGHDRAERQRRIAELTASTGLAPFAGRPAGKLSGGMKQKLGLCCALIHDPDLLILDEPTTGVDPLSPAVLGPDAISAPAARMASGATAYMEEGHASTARGDGCRTLLASGSPANCWNAGSGEPRSRLHRPAARRGARRQPRSSHPARMAARGDRHRGAWPDQALATFPRWPMSASHSARRIFASSAPMAAADHHHEDADPPSPVSEAEASLFGRKVDATTSERRRVGYIRRASRLFRLTVRQNLEQFAPVQHAGVRHPRPRREMPEPRPPAILDALPDALPLGQRQRLSWPGDDHGPRC